MIPPISDDERDAREDAWEEHQASIAEPEEPEQDDMSVPGGSA